MSEGDLLRQAIIADPDDDTARLVFADWLQENGKTERADFIRAQIEATRAEPFSVKARKAAQRARELLEPRQNQWTQHLPEAFAEWPRFERGFVADVSIEPTRFVPNAEAIFEAEPIQALKLYRFNSITERHSFAPLFELPILRRVRRIELSSHLFSAEEYELISGCKHLGGLRELSLRENPVPPAWLAKILTTDMFPHLHALDVADSSHLGPTLSDALQRAGHRRFKRLDLSGVAFRTSEQLQRVLTSRCLRQVEELFLATHRFSRQLGPLFHLNLGWVIPWDRLTLLDLSGQHLGNEGVVEITMRKEAAGLRWLSLASNELGREAIRLLLNAKHLTLNYLDVRGNGFAPDDLEILRQRFPEAMILG